MSGTSYDAECPKCNGVLFCSSDWKPHESVSGECHNCGYYYFTQDGNMKLKEVNEIRADWGKRKLKKLRKQSY